MSADLEASRVHLRVQVLLVHQLPRLLLCVALRDEEDAGTSIHNKQIERHVAVLQLHASVPAQRGQLGRVGSGLENEGAHGVIGEARDDDGGLAFPPEAHRRRPLDRKGSHHVVRLEVQMVDGRVGAEAVIPRAEKGVRRLGHHLDRHLKQVGLDLLRQVVQHSRDQQHVPVLDRADVDHHQVGAVVEHLGVAQVGARVRGRVELEQRLLLRCLGEVELGGVEGLLHEVHAELGGALFQRTSLVQLRHEADSPGDHLG
mmetsp:Transcript_3509/g.5960  ORF Transcript_3509/g.5960 Transcript_3509/m.5960 type:complete len:258 (-) Transcript_3509:1171-1944(-)